MCLDDCNEFSPLPTSFDSDGVIPCAPKVTVVTGGVGKSIEYHGEFANEVLKLFIELCIMGAVVCGVIAGLDWVLA